MGDGVTRYDKEDHDLGWAREEDPDDGEFDQPGCLAEAAVPCFVNVPREPDEAGVVDNNEPGGDAAHTI